MCKKWRGDMHINTANYEIYLVRYMDDDLDENEKAELEVFLFEHPNLRAELNAFENTILTVDEELTFKDKASLKRKRSRRVFSLNRLDVFLPVAAIVILAVSIGFWLTRTGSDYLQLLPVVDIQPESNSKDLFTGHVRALEDTIVHSLPFEEEFLADEKREVKMRKESLEVIQVKNLWEIKEPIELIPIQQALLELPEIIPSPIGLEFPEPGFIMAEGSRKMRSQLLSINFNRQSNLTIEREQEKDKQIFFTLETSFLKISGNIPNF